MHSIGPWAPVSLCKTCGYELDRQAIYDAKVCPGCAATATFCLATVRTAKRWVRDFQPTLWQRCKGQKAVGHWEWSGKAEGGTDCTVTTGMLPGRRIASGMNTVTVAAAGIASGLF